MGADGNSPRSDASGGAPTFAPRSVEAMTIRAAHADADMPVVRDLFLEYAASLGFSLCFQGFDDELASLPGKYAPPKGLILLAESSSGPLGCVGLRPLHAPGTCEMKRLYVRPAARRFGLGRHLALAIVDAGATLGYAAMRLDTLPQMTAAIALYQSLGFEAIAPYYDNPIDGALYLEKRYVRP